MNFSLKEELVSKEKRLLGMHYFSHFFFRSKKKIKTLKRKIEVLTIRGYCLGYKLRKDLDTVSTTPRRNSSILGRMMGS